MLKSFTATLLALFLAPTTGHTATVKDWTLLVFINGHNNLDKYGDSDINEMEKIGSTDAVNIVVQRGTLRQNTTRLLVQKDTDPKNVTSPAVLDLGKKVDMGSYANLVDFVKWGADNYPAKHYFVVVWNHGSGWQRSFEAGMRGIAYDDIYGTHITTKQLGTSMKDFSGHIGRKVDMLGSDACLMAQPDIASEMIDYVDVYVGSEETEPLEGWPYDALLAPWVAKPTMTSIEISQLLADVYIKSYQGGSQGTNDATTMSAFDLKLLSQLENGVNELGKSIRALPASERAKVLAAAKNTQEFFFSDYKDLGDFLKQVKSANIRGLRAELLGEVTTTLTKFVIANKTSDELNLATGASFWLPTTLGEFNAHKTQYLELEFHKRTEWGFALESLLK